MKITIACAGLSGNSGDDLIAYSEISAIKENLSNESINTINFYPLCKKIILSQDSINIYLQNHLENTIGDIVIIGGGALIQNFRNPSALLPRIYYLSREIIKQKSKYVVYGVSITSNLNPISKYLAKQILSKAEQVFCRDPKSTELANKLINSNKSLCCYDSVLDSHGMNYANYYSISSDKIENSSLSQAGSILFIPSLDTRAEHQKYEQIIQFFRQSVLLAKKMSLPLIKVGFSSLMNRLDKIFIKEIYDLENKIEIQVTDLTHADKLFKEIYSSNLVLTGRLHPGIVSYKLKIPFLLFSPTSKMENLFNEQHYWRDSSNQPNINNSEVGLESLSYDKLEPSSLIDLVKLVQQINF
jgi:polysaccharide pyruvyl transferase WcaK-like protein